LRATSRGRGASGYEIPDQVLGLTHDPIRAGSSRARSSIFEIKQEQSVAMGMEIPSTQRQSSQVAVNVSRADSAAEMAVTDILYAGQLLAKMVRWWRRPRASLTLTMLIVYIRQCL
jgi:hypothetical protein